MFYNHLNNEKKIGKMKTGIELIAIERQEQIEKHGRSVLKDSEQNTAFQLSDAASILCVEDRHTVEDAECCPLHWDENTWVKMFNKSYKERLIIAGALIAAELDRLNHTGK